MEMEMETTTTEAIAKKLWNLTRVMVMMVRKGFAKSKFLIDLTLLLKRTNKLAGKAIHSLVLSGAAGPHLSSTPSFSCKSSNDAVSSFISPKDYEFSCSNSPANYPKRNRRRHHRSGHLDEAATLAAVQRVLETINAGYQSPEIGLPGFGMSPVARQLRITDSPFPVKENEEESVQVNMAADEFIKRFYRDLKLQKSLTVDSPYHDTWNF